MFKIDNKNASVFIVKFKHNSQLFLVFSIVDFEQANVSCVLLQINLTL